MWSRGSAEWLSKNLQRKRAFVLVRHEAVKPQSIDHKYHVGRALSVTHSIVSLTLTTKLPPPQIEILQAMAGRNPVVGWVSTEPVFHSTARGLLEEEYVLSSANSGGASSYTRGRIGSTNVIVGQLPQDSQGEEIDDQWAEGLSDSLSEIEAILVTGLVDGSGNPDIKDGDLIIYSTAASGHEVPGSSALNTLQGAVEVLHKEAGADGFWLTGDASLDPSGIVNHTGSVRILGDTNRRHPRLHYMTNSARAAQPDASILQTQIDKLTKKVIAGITKGGAEIIPPLICVLGATCQPDPHDDGHWKHHLSSTTSLYVQELFRMRSNPLLPSGTSLNGTETVLEAPPCPSIPRFEPHHYQSHGSALLVVIPTNNKGKIGLCEKYIKNRIAGDVDVHTVIVPVESDVGEQPYNEAGILGAHNRISNAMHRLASAEYQDTLRTKKIGTVLFMAIESFIQTDRVLHPADYGVVVVHNATSQKSTSCLSCGVTVPPAFVERALRFGCVGDPNCGRVTVGQILAAHVPGLDKADWHLPLAGRSRYDILEDAIKELPLPG